VKCLAVIAGVPACAVKIGLALVDVDDAQRPARRQVAREVDRDVLGHAAVEVPEITGTSLVPWIVTVTSCEAVPSEETAVKSR